ncbi:CKLF-like MARVEL transmembrane domain-containing protein 8 [Myxocyprinus asiaticus]|uniref:CKLF-like MARVEL transmembrane domain-containing protein 8 n=1 Tax=Myxocyprinus asiaticus TaxID=70543 RepID=UPI0022231C7B|nr:CKLF-like MARVEL transmembrane domain-containing protein 8 [Myxocyprinus asiaticus]
MGRSFGLYPPARGKQLNIISGAERLWVASMAENPNSRPVITTTSTPYQEFRNSSTPWYDKLFMQIVPKYLIVVEIILGLLVWTLIASTDYFRFPPFGWVLFVSVFCWVLTLFLLIIILANGQIQQVPWTTLVLIFNSSAAVLYMSAAIVEAMLVNKQDKGHNDYIYWAASTFFAFVVSLSYAGSAFFNFKSWKNGDEGRCRWCFLIQT